MPKEDVLYVEEVIERMEDEKLRLLQNQSVTRHDPNVRGRHSVVCRHWIRNMCMKGDFCDFLHQYDYERMPPCFTYQKYGVCVDEALGNCPFKHKADETPLCAQYFLGFCKFGPKCKRRHEPKARHEIPDFLPDSFLQTIIVDKSLIPKMDPETLSIVKLLEDICKDNYAQAICTDSTVNSSSK
ncbi:zinc finger (CCCH type) domain-containing protein [Cryptosporidium muris RN66]|uniref:Zinc finger (CCCH type) domain-containing protein n=1 Tax=Cryptosporidium muris (strain RN66) TaxID=441375 RepID=B6ADN4_CRYMR|nr:zinc finger (CCCH type) domain-containing protein [Cryptosporidium muris RN66]EEA06325.1 zinc finger (CCCH type) domain-containing protein [Cryptosporidium muris RN66]|eukprot:XP_002140674.1 zinc finger (CCCH type) domain-containing protein [Cryptosporidium muris RN66]